MATLVSVGWAVLWIFGSILGLMIFWGISSALVQAAAYKYLERPERVRTYERHTSSHALDMYGDIDPERCFYTETVDGEAKVQADQIGTLTGLGITFLAAIGWILWWVL